MARADKQAAVALGEASWGESDEEQMAPATEPAPMPSPDSGTRSA